MSEDSLDYFEVVITGENSFAILKNGIEMNAIEVKNLINDFCKLCNIVNQYQDIILAMQSELIVLKKSYVPDFSKRIH